MRYSILGRTGVRVSRVALGTGFFGDPIPKEECARILNRAIELGINFIDTAEGYRPNKPGLSETILGEQLLSMRDEIVLATKVDPVRAWDDQIANQGLSRRVVIRAVEGSLRRLQTDYIDILYAHKPDPQTPLTETLRAFDDLIRDGKVRYVGLSKYPAWEVVESLWQADHLGLHPIAATQDLYNLLDRDSAREIYPACSRYGVAAIAYSPLAGGILSGKYSSSMVGRGNRVPSEWRGSYYKDTSDSVRPGPAVRLTKRNIMAAERLEEWSRARGYTSAQVALAWVLGEPAVSSAIVGVTNVNQLESNSPAFHLELNPDARAQIAALVED